MHYFSPWNGERFPKGNRRWDAAHLVVRKPRCTLIPSQTTEAGEMGRSGLTKTEADDHPARVATELGNLACRLLANWAGRWRNLDAEDPT